MAMDKRYDQNMSGNKKENILQIIMGATRASCLKDLSNF